MSIRFEFGAHLAPLIEELAGESGWADSVIRTGHEDLDETLNGGLRAGQLILIAGAAGVGTSTFALGFARNAAFREELRTVFIAPESSKRELLSRVVAAEARVPLSNLRRNRLDNSERSKLDRHLVALSRAPLLINAQWRTMSSAEELLDAAQLSVSSGARLVVVDGIAGAEPRVRDLIKRLSALAVTHRAAVVLVSDVLGRRHQNNVRPTLEDLRHYEQIADLVDLVMMLHRDDQHDWNSTRPGEADLEIVKHRYGPQRLLPLAFQGHYARFVDVAS
jgi:replicative DNA helicase